MRLVIGLLVFFGLYWIYRTARSLWKRADVIHTIEEVLETEEQFDEVNSFKKEHNLKGIQKKKQAIENFINKGEE